MDNELPPLFRITVPVLAARVETSFVAAASE
jgi:hypothetical protein